MLTFDKKHFNIINVLEEFFSRLLFRLHVCFSMKKKTMQNIFVVDDGNEQCDKWVEKSMFEYLKKELIPTQNEM